MQKNLPKYAPDWIRSVTWWAESSRREVRYALCDDRRTLLWLANQRAVEYHPTLVRAGERPHRPSYLILDIDPPARRAVRAGGGGRQADPGGAGRRGPGRRGQDQRVQGRCTCSCRSRTPTARTRPRPPGPSPARRAPGSGAGHDGVRRRGPRRQGVPGLDPGVRRHRGGGLQPAGAARGAGIVPGPLGRPGLGDAGATSPCTPCRGCWLITGRGRRELPAPQALPAGAGRGGPGHPGRPGPGHARGQAPQEGGAAGPAGRVRFSWPGSASVSLASAGVPALAQLRPGGRRAGQA